MPADRPFLILNLRTLQLQGAVARVDVTDPESQLLCALIDAPGNRLTCEALLVHLHLPLDDAGKRALGVRVARLRKKLLAAGASNPTLKAIRTSGYQLCVFVQLRTITANAPSLSSSLISHV